MHPKIIMPRSFWRRGLAFEELVRRILLIFFDYQGIFAKSYLRSASGRWTQLDSILMRGRDAFLLEVKFPKTPLSTKTLLPKVNFARQIGCSGLLLVTRQEEKRDFPSDNFDGFVTSLNWGELYSALFGDYSNCYITRDVEPLSKRDSRFFSANGNSLDWQGGSLSSDGEFAIVPDDVERWLRRLPILTGAHRLCPMAGGEYEFKYGDGLPEKVKELIEIEEALSGFSATHPSLIADCGLELAYAGSSTSTQLHRRLILRGRRVLPQAVSSALADMRLMGLVEVDRGRQSSLSKTGAGIFVPPEIEYLIWQRAFGEWRPQSAIASSGLSFTKENLNAIREHFDLIYLRFRPYLKNLFNLNKLRGILDLSIYLENACSHSLPKGR
jgi:hypothetical protein